VRGLPVCPGTRRLRPLRDAPGFEDNQVRVGKTAYLGYQEVRRPGRAPYAQVRLTGVIKEFAPRAPTADGGVSTGG
jgi:hypothetical protein